MIDIELNELFKPDYVFMNIKPLQKTKKQALRLVSKLCAPKCGFQEEVLLKAFLDREAMGSTGIGEGIAVPHAQISDLNTPIIAIVRFANKIAWSNRNNEPVEVAVVLITPKENNKNMIKVITAFARKLIHKEFISALKNIENEKELYQFIMQELSTL